MILRTFELACTYVEHMATRKIFPEQDLKSVGDLASLSFPTLITMDIKWCKNIFNAGTSNASNYCFSRDLVY